ncbi:hypothetical protein NOR51B_1800 [Luminiphilus syltensis NOR5-1B]|uniref:Uncharacterized protein n=2 Tax=Luminiphilus TaxID=1341118 RepID=B8KX50_9GAMM|nr:hypothetical protein NOR51B_1800 [Luminiphilus syltensis NOR5-1B]
MMISLLVMLSPRLFAAEQRVTWTDVVWVEGHYEIVHRIAISDAEELLTAMQVTVDVESSEALTLMALYVEAGFKATAGDTPVAIETYSAEIDDHFVYVSQGLLGANLDTVPRFDNQLLNHLPVEVANIISIDVPGLSKTFVADQASTRQSSPEPQPEPTVRWSI